MSTDLALTARTEPAKIIAGRIDSMLSVLPQHDPRSRERFAQVAMAVANDQKLVNDCRGSSLVLAIYGCARLGLVPDKALGHVHIVPFKGVATVVIGYQGFVELARRSGELGAVYTGVVREGEEYRYWVDERGPHMLHTPADVSEGKITHAYCVATIRGEPQIERMTIAEIEKRNTGSPVWKHWYTEQVRKTVLRRAAKLWPLSPELALALRLDERAEADKPQHDDLDDGRVTVLPPEDVADPSLDALLAESDGDADPAPKDEPATEPSGMTDEEKQRIIEQEKAEVAQADEIPY